MATIQYVTLKNRTSKSLTGQWDGKQYTFEPGYEGKWPEYIALKFKEQNPVMGSEDWFSGYKSYLLGILEHGDDMDAIEQTTSPTKWDQSTVMLPPGTQLAIVKGRGYHPIQDRGRPAPSLDGVKMESFEPEPGFEGTETVKIVDPIDYKP